MTRPFEKNSGTVGQWDTGTVGQLDKNGPFVLEHEGKDAVGAVTAIEAIMPLTKLWLSGAWSVQKSHRSRFFMMAFSGLLMVFWPQIWLFEACRWLFQPPQILSMAS
jgi:hypothetical protein